MKHPFMNDSKILILGLICFFLVLGSCQHETVNVIELKKINFEKDVLPIFMSNCTASGCHGGDGSGDSQLTLTNYDDIVNEVTKGKASSSRLFSAITATWGGIMPPNKPLSTSQIATIRLWIDQGAEYSKDTTAIIDTTSNIDTTKFVEQKFPVCFSRDILPIISSNCAECHNYYNSYSGILKIVTPGNISNSKFYEVITASGEDRMPKGLNAPLSKANIDSIKNWILAGAKNGDCPTNTCDTSKHAFTANVFPLIKANCTGCHAGNTAFAGIKLEDYNTVLAQAQSGMLIKAINGTGVKLMPLSGSLSPCAKTLIENWVKDGAKKN